MTTGSGTVNFAVTGTTTNGANGADFSTAALPTGTVTILAGETTRVLNFNVVGDRFVELDEGFIVTLNSPTGGTIATASASGTIINDDTSLSITANSAVKAEGQTGATPFTFIVTRTGFVSGATTVNYVVTESTSAAANGSDFVGNVLPTGSVSFAAGELSKTITIDVAGDTLVESIEGFLVTLQNVVGLGVVGVGTANGSIQNDD